MARPVLVTEASSARAIARRAVARHLRLGGLGQQHRDVMAEAGLPETDLTQAVDE